MTEESMETMCPERVEPHVVSDTATTAALGILSLSEDILVRIINLLTPREVALFGAVCRRFRQAAGADGLVWAPFCRSIVGTESASSPQQWGCPTFQVLYTRLLRTYGELLGGLWHADLRPLGSLLVAFPSPPHIIGAVVASLRLAEPGVSVVPIFRVSYDPQRGAPAVTCLRAPNTFGIMLWRAETVPPPDDPDMPHPGELRLEYAPASAAPNVPYWEGQGGDRDLHSVDSEELVLDVDGEVDGEEEDGGVAAFDSDDVEYDVAQAVVPPHEVAAIGGGEVGGGGVAAGEGPGVAAGPGSTVHGTGPTGPAATETLPGAYGWGCGGAQLSRFTLQCSAACRHHDVEAVCRWIPHGLTPLPERMLVQSRASTGAAVGYAGSSSSGRGTEGQGSSGSAALAPLDAGGLVDLDVLAAFGERERVQRVKWTLLGQLSYPMSTPVSYRRVRSRPIPAAAGAAVTFAATGATAATPTAPGDIAAASGPGSLGEAASAALPESGPVANSSAVAGWAGAVGGGEAPQPRPGVLCLQAQPQPQAEPQPHPLEGIWRGTYGGHGFEMLHVQRVDQQLLEGRKLTGDDNVPAGAVSFRIYLDHPGPTAAQQRGAPFRVPPDYVSRLDPISIGPAVAEGDAAGGGPGDGPARRPRAPIVLEAFAAQGQVAGSGFHAPQWIEAEAVVLGRDTFGLLWHGLRSVSAFQRVRLAVGP